MCRERGQRRESTFERGNILARDFIPLFPPESLSLVYLWYSWLTRDWVPQRGDGVTVSLSISQRGICEYKKGLQTTPLWVCLKAPSTIASPCAEAFCYEGHGCSCRLGSDVQWQCITAKQQVRKIHPSPWFMDVIPLVWQQARAFLEQSVRNKRL